MVICKKNNGKFLIRIEDTDNIRSKTEYTKNILEGLTWLGLAWDEEPILQSKRNYIHKDYIKKFLENGSAYRCFTTENEISELRENQKKLGLLQNMTIDIETSLLRKLKSLYHKEDQML